MQRIVWTIFNISGDGYIIVNIKDLSVPEYSLDNSNPFLGVENPIYNGGLGYYYKTDDKIISLMTGREYSIDDFNEVYSMKEIENKEEFLREIQARTKKRLLRNVVRKSLRGSLERWYIDGGNCGSIACAIVMKYYRDYVSEMYVRDDKLNQNSLIRLMQDYVGVGSTNTTHLVSGLNTYLQRMGINNYARYSDTFDFDLIKNKIDSNRPVIVDTDNHPTYEEHWIIAHGYSINTIGNELQFFIIVNNGWGENNIYLEYEANRRYLDDLVYLNK
ncbi:MAG: C10 family peptidase [Lachnospiraceae bacterium]|nr:C10 family peptidase [Lachnospiraceae bacterium]